MSTESHACWLAKRGNSPEEYEDAFAANDAAGRYAVADGASESSFAGLWARLLVDQFAEDLDHDPIDWSERLPALQSQWHTQVGQRPLPWYAEAQFQRGSFAAFLGVALSTSSDGLCAWQAVGVGDSCLFQTRGADLIVAFPLDRSDRFDNMPHLVGSRTRPEVVRQKRALHEEGYADPGDRLWLMTDALAHWCLREHEMNRNPWEQMERLLTRPSTRETFSHWIGDLRDTKDLRNDDVTLLAIRV